MRSSEPVPWLHSSNLPRSSKLIPPSCDLASCGSSSEGMRESMRHPERVNTCTRVLSLTNTFPVLSMQMP